MVRTKTRVRACRTLYTACLAGSAASATIAVSLNVCGLLGLLACRDGVAGTVCGLTCVALLMYKLAQSLRGDI